MDSKIIRNESGDMLILSEFSLENEFLYRMAVGNGSEEDLGGSVADRSLDPNMQEDAENGAPLQEGEDIKNTLEEPDDKMVDTIDWDNFDIDDNINYAAKLQDPEQQGLNETDAKKKSFFIKYVDPKDGRQYGVMGPMFGKNKEEGVGQAYVGGYETREEAQKDLDQMKSMWDKFPKDREYMLVDLSQLSPDLITYEKQKQDELPEKVEDQNKQAEEADKKETEEKPEENKEMSEDEIKDALGAEEQTNPTPATPAPVSKSKTQPSVPKPIGKVPAYLIDMRMKKEARLEKLRNIKG